MQKKYGKDRQVINVNNNNDLKKVNALTECIYIYDEKNTIGKDVKIEIEGIVIITVRKNTTLTNVRQAMYRFRSIYKKKQIYFIIMYFGELWGEPKFCKIIDVSNTLLKNENEKIDKMWIKYSCDTQTNVIVK